MREERKCLSQFPCEVLLGSVCQNDKVQIEYRLFCKQGGKLSNCKISTEIDVTSCLMEFNLLDNCNSEALYKLLWLQIGKS